MEEKVKEILANYTEVSKEDMTRESNLLTDLALTSLDVASIAADFEDEFDVEIPDRKIPDLVTIGNIVDYLVSMEA